jgi:hypothetical protein
MILTMFTTSLASDSADLLTSAADGEKLGKDIA